MHFGGRSWSCTDLAFLAIIVVGEDDAGGFIVSFCSVFFDADLIIFMVLLHVVLVQQMQSSLLTKQIF